MEGDDVDDDRREQRQRQGNVATCEKKRAGDDLDAFDEREHVPGCGERSQELTRGPGVVSHRKKTQETVQPKDEEHRAKNDACRRLGFGIVRGHG